MCRVEYPTALNLHGARQPSPRRSRCAGRRARILAMAEAQQIHDICRTFGLRCHSIAKRGPDSQLICCDCPGYALHDIQLASPRPRVAGASGTSSVTADSSGAAPPLALGSGSVPIAAESVLCRGFRAMFCASRAARRLRRIADPAPATPRREPARHGREEDRDAAAGPAGCSQATTTEIFSFGRHFATCTSWRNKIAARGVSFVHEDNGCDCGWR